MYFSDLDKVGYPVGTFKLGQKIYHIKDKEHRFKFHKKCEYCESTGRVLIKGKEFTCPACKGEYIYKEIIEKIIDDYNIRIGSIISLQNKKSTYEYYATNSAGYGLQINRCDDGSNTYNKYSDKIGEYADGILETKKYDDGTVRYNIVDLP